jgi:hypothetical protein
MSASLISFENGNLVLNTELPLTHPLKTRIVSIIGKARMGKSTFLNTLATFLKKQNIAPFAARDDIEHCTRGVDYFYIPEENILLLDCQGLAWEDSQNDHKLLLLIYSISDMIIFNERMMLQNETLKLLEPICTFLHYISREGDELPRLFFRISDGGVVKSPKLNLEKLLASHKDAYQTIRESIQQLFHAEIGAVKTESLTPVAAAHLGSDNYADVIATDECGFRSAIEAILAACPVDRKESPLTQIPRTIAQINGNEKITIEKLDIVKLTSENDIRQWKDESVPAEMFTAIQVDGTQAAFDDRVEPRKRQKTNILSTFSRRFKAVPESIKRPFYEDLSTRMTEPITKATQQCLHLAEELVHGYERAASQPRILASYTSAGSTSFLNLAADYAAQITPQLTALEEACKLIYIPIREKYNEWIKRMRGSINTSLKQIQELERAEYAAADEICQVAAESFNDWALAQPLPDDFCRQTNAALLEKFVQDRLASVCRQIYDGLTRRQLRFSMVHGTYDYHVSAEIMPVEVGYYQADIMQYSLVKPLLETMLEKLRTAPPLHEYLITQKNGFLRNKAVYSDSLYITANPEITFVFYQPRAGGIWIPNVKGHWITMETHTAVFNAAVYKPTEKALVAKGYCTQEIAEKILAVQQQNNRMTIYHTASGDEHGFDNVLLRIWNMTASKMFCKAHTAGLIPAMPVLS